MLSRIRSWFDLSRVSSWRPGSGRHHRQRRRRSGAPGGGGGGSFNRDRRLSFPELSAATAAANSSNNNNSTTMSESSENQQNQQNQQQNHHPHHHHHQHHQQTPVEPVTVVAYHPKVQPEEVALPSNNNNNPTNASVNTLSSTSYQNDRSSVQSHHNGSGGNHHDHDRHHRRRSTSFFRRYLLCCCCCCCTGKSSGTDSSSNSGVGGGGGGINPNRAQSYRPREPSANSASDPAASNIAHRVYSSSGTSASESSLNPQFQQVALEAEASKPAPLAQLSPEQLLRSTTTEQKNCNEFANTSLQYPHHQQVHHNHPQPQPQPQANLQLALKDKRPELLMLAQGSMMMALKETASSSSASASKQSFLEKLAKKGKVASANNGGHPLSGASIFQTQLSKGSLEVSSKRIMKELSDLMRRQQTREDVSTAETITSTSTSTPNTKMGVHLSTKSQFTVELVNDVLYEWYIKIYEFDRESQIYLDMQQYKVPFVKLHAVFPNSYPFDPPFIRVVAPYIERGYVMEGGAICLELLTKAGWTSAYTMEAVVVQLMASFVKGQARIRANKDVSKCFTRKSAENSFR
ncbi:ubiquitin-conjugating enzyme [Tyrophagus putrescentiae]|nr:ubiquitin-conjugating enzyme [Tyrophagus putrescentiae]